MRGGVCRGRMRVRARACACACVVPHRGELSKLLDGGGWPDGVVLVNGHFHLLARLFVDQKRLDRNNLAIEKARLLRFGGVDVGTAGHCVLVCAGHAILRSNILGGDAHRQE